MSEIVKRINKIENEIQKACLAHKRNRADIQLIAVSKRHPACAIEEAFNAGIRAFGENYCQEALDKQQALSHLDIDWHFIGPVQSNKTHDIAQHFNWLHSLDREKIAKRLSRQRPEHMPPLQVLIQVNIDDEASKSGIPLEQLSTLAQTVIDLPQLELRGLMTLPNPAKPAIDGFISLARALNMLQQQFPNNKLDTLSMGMSQDMSPAIDAGATMVRIGTAIFGQRP